MLDSLPPGVLVSILQHVGPHAASFLCSCRATSQLTTCPHALTQWLLSTYGPEGAMLALARAPCVLTWQYQRVVGVVDVLLKSGAQPCSMGRQLLVETCASGHAAEVSALLGMDASASVMMQPTYLASALKAATERGCVEVVKVASERGCVEVVKVLLAVGSDPRADTDCALRCAAARGFANILAILIDGGSDVHAKQDEALCLAVGGRHTESVLLLLKYRAAPHTCQLLPIAAFNCTAAAFNCTAAAFNCTAAAGILTYMSLLPVGGRHTESVLLLLKYGADPNARQLLPIAASLPTQALELDSSGVGAGGSGSCASLPEEMVSVLLAAGARDTDGQALCALELLDEFRGNPMPAPADLDDALASAAAD
eukprot:gene434-1831_t